MIIRKRIIMPSLRSLVALLAIPPTALCAIFPESTSNFTIHDPAAIYHNDAYYVFAGSMKGPGVPYYKAPNLYGDYVQVGRVLQSGSKIKEPGENSNSPWAPAVVEKDGTFYVYYAVTKGGSQDSAIGVAQTDRIDDPKSWVDQGAIIFTGQGPDHDVGAQSASNAIDPSVLIDPQTKTPVLQWGSFFGGIFQAPLADDMISLRAPNGRKDAVRVAYSDEAATGGVTKPGQKWGLGAHPIEGSALSHNDDWYYLWFAHGACCGLEAVANEIPIQDVYQIRIGRSRKVSGPFLDKEGKDLNQGGGSTMIASHDWIFAPGGPSVMKGADGEDILYYHYLNKDVDFTEKTVRFGWNKLSYQDGWPVIVSAKPSR